MGRIVVTEFISLDGVIEAPGGGEEFEHGGWTFEIERGAEGDRGGREAEGGGRRGDPGRRQRPAGAGLLEHDLVDELRLMVFPVVLGSGKRLFGPSAEKLPLRLADSKVVGDGIAILTYERAATLSPQPS